MLSTARKTVVTHKIGHYFRHAKSQEQICPKCMVTFVVFAFLSAKWVDWKIHVAFCHLQLAQWGRENNGRSDYSVFYVDKCGKKWTKYGTEWVIVLLPHRREAFHCPRACLNSQKRPLFSLPSNCQVSPKDIGVFDYQCLVDCMSRWKEIVGSGRRQLPTGKWGGCPGVCQDSEWLCSLWIFSPDQSATFLKE